MSLYVINKLRIEIPPWPERDFKCVECGEPFKSRAGTARRCPECREKRRIAKKRKK